MILPCFVWKKLQAYSVLSQCMDTHEVARELFDRCKSSANFIRTNRSLAFFSSHCCKPYQSLFEKYSCIHAVQFNSWVHGQTALGPFVIINQLLCLENEYSSTWNIERVEAKIWPYRKSVKQTKLVCDLWKYICLRRQWKVWSMNFLR